MEFKDLQLLIYEQWELMSKFPLFRVNINNNISLSNIYLQSFKKGDDPIFRNPNSTTHNCTLDKHFLNHYGNVVAIDDNYNIITLFDIDLSENSIYYSPIKELQKIVLSSTLNTKFYVNKRTTFEKCNDILSNKPTSKKFIVKLKQKNLELLNLTKTTHLIIFI